MSLKWKHVNGVGEVNDRGRLLLLNKRNKLVVKNGYYTHHQSHSLRLKWEKIPIETHKNLLKRGLVCQNERRERGKFAKKDKCDFEQIECSFM